MRRALSLCALLTVYSFQGPHSARLASSRAQAERGLSEVSTAFRFQTQQGCLVPEPRLSEAGSRSVLFQCPYLANLFQGSIGSFPGHRFSEDGPRSVQLSGTDKNSLSKEILISGPRPSEAAPLLVLVSGTRFRQDCSDL